MHCTVASEAINFPPPAHNDITDRSPQGDGPRAGPRPTDRPTARARRGLTTVVNRTVTGTIPLTLCLPVSAKTPERVASKPPARGTFDFYFLGIRRRCRTRTEEAFLPSCHHGMGTGARAGVIAWPGSTPTSPTRAPRAAAAAAAWQLNLIFIAAKKVSRPAGNGGA